MTTTERTSVVSIRRSLVLELLAIARRGTRTDRDAETVAEVQLIARTERKPDDGLRMV